MESDKFGKVTNMIDTVSVTLKTDTHIDDLIKHSNTLITAEFVVHMQREALAKPSKFGHMYEWGQVGDPNGRLWRHVLRGRGASRQLSFDFKASKKAVPVAPRLAAIGVRRNHIFTWKAPVMELGKPVSISPKLAKMLVFEAKEVKRGASSSGTGYQADGRVFYNGTINISRAGSKDAWGSFTEEFNTWMRSGIPEQLIKAKIQPAVHKGIKRAVLNKLVGLRKTNPRVKTITFEPVGIDRNFAATLAQSLRTNYIAGAASRRALTDD